MTAAQIRAKLQGIRASGSRGLQLDLDIEDLLHDIDDRARELVGPRGYPGGAGADAAERAELAELDHEALMARCDALLEQGAPRAKHDETPPGPRPGAKHDETSAEPLELNTMKPLPVPGPRTPHELACCGVKQQEGVTFLPLPVEFWKPARGCDCAFCSHKEGVMEDAYWDTLAVPGEGTGYGSTWLCHKPELHGKTELRGNKALKPADVVRIVATIFGILPSDIRGPSRKRMICQARQMSIYIMVHYLRTTHQEAIDAVGRKDHTTAIYHRKAFLHRVNRDPNTAARFARARVKLGGLEL